MKTTLTKQRRITKRRIVSRGRKKLTKREKFKAFRKREEALMKRGAGMLAADIAAARERQSKEYKKGIRPIF